MPILNDDFVVRQPSVTRLAFNKWFGSNSRKLKFFGSSEVLVDVKYGGGEDIGEDNDGNEKKKVKFK